MSKSDELLTKMRSVRPCSKLGNDWTDADYLEHFESQCIATATGCLEWQGGLCKGPPHKNGPTCKGYPIGGYRGKAVRLTRLILGWKLGRPLTRSERACHSCDNTVCISHEHLWAGTDKDNMQDAGAKRRWPRQYRDHCINGHPRSPENMTHHGREKKLGCKQCNHERYVREWPKKRERILARLRVRRAQKRANLLERRSYVPEPNRDDPLDPEDVPLGR
jgi:hypothetical protein